MVNAFAMYSRIESYTLVYKNHKNNGIAGINDYGMGEDFSSFVDDGILKARSASVQNVLLWYRVNLQIFVNNDE